MQKFLSLHLLTGIIRKAEISQYWSTDPLLVTAIFNNIMSRNRYQSILELLHFNDNTFYDAADPGRDRLFNVRPLIEHLIKRFKEAYIPSREIVIYEELMFWKGRLGFKQCIPNKRWWFVIKVFQVMRNKWLPLEFVCLPWLCKRLSWRCCLDGGAWQKWSSST